LVQAGATIVAGSIAGYAGGKLGEFSGSIDEEKEVIGDNKEQVLQKFKTSRLLYYEKIAQGMYNEMQNLFFVPQDGKEHQQGRSLTGRQAACTGHDMLFRSRKNHLEGQFGSGTYCHHGRT
jgi:hypothetical protein